MQKLLFLSILAVLAAGCSSSAIVDPGPNISPGIGSTYTYQVRQYNLDGTVQSTDTATITMTDVQSAWNGQQNVYQFNNGHSYVYQSNGDLDTWLGESQPYKGDSEWVLMPFSGGAATRTVFYSSDSATDALHAQFVVSSSRTVAGTLLATNEVEVIDSTTKKNSAGVPVLYTQTDNYWFAPTIGAMAEVDFGIFTNAKTGVQAGKKVETLIAMDLK